MVGTAAHISLQDKALGALLGGALGDALGMPTQTLTTDQISALYGRIDDLAPSHPDNSVSRGLPAGAITDDTEQTLLMAEQLISSPDHFDNHQWAQTLLEWERDVRARGLYDMLGPSTKRALSALIDGAPVDEVGKNGTTNGAAMRVSPIALATPAYPIEALIEEVEKSCRLTHNTPQAIAGAAAVAAALSIALDGASLEKMIEHAQA
ncbi:MAG: ADP-ribosylglycohydrolase family protein, partial [Hyphomicrobiales bacterium]